MNKSRIISSRSSLCPTFIVRCSFILVHCGVSCTLAVAVSDDLPLTTVILHQSHRRMAGDDDDDDDANDYVTTTTVTPPMGLPPTVVALLGRMTSYSDRMAWTVVEDACRVRLTLSWDVEERRRRQRCDGRQRSLEVPCDSGSAGPTGSCKESLWSRIRRSLHSRRSVSVDSTTADVRRHQQQPQVTSNWRSRDVNDERACAARDRWRSAVKRHRSVSATRGVSGTADVGSAAAWRQRRQRSWNDADIVVQSTDTKDLLIPTGTGAVQSRGRLLPSLSLPERFLSPPPLHHHYQLHHHQHYHHQQQQQQLTPQEEFLQVHPPQYNCSTNSDRQTQLSVSSLSFYWTVITCFRPTGLMLRVGCHCQSLLSKSNQIRK